MSKLRIEEIIVVEGKYDAVKLSDLVDALIVPTKGFSIFTSEETKQLILRLGKKRGIIVLTDSDAAGFRIRNYVNKIAAGLPVKTAYVPALAGKEKRKSQPSKEGLLGVEEYRQRQSCRRCVRQAPIRRRNGREDRLPIRICLNWACPERREVQSAAASGSQRLGFRLACPKKHCAKL